MCNGCFTSARKRCVLDPGQRTASVATRLVDIIRFLESISFVAYRQVLQIWLYTFVKSVMAKTEQPKCEQYPSASPVSKDDSLPLLSKATMAEKRRSGGSGILADPKSAKSDSDKEFLSQTGVGVLLRGALLKLVEARSEDPIGFLADHFSNLASESENGSAGCGDAEQTNTSEEQQQLGRAMWHLRLAHHSQRSAFNNNVRVAYELLMKRGQRRRVGGGVRGSIYTEMLRFLCSEGEVPELTAAPLLRRIQCHDHEAVPFELFRQGVLTCAVFSDYVRKSRSLYVAVCPCPDTPAERSLCQAVLETLRDALDTSHCADSARYLEASAKIAPCKLAEAMALAHNPGQTQTGPTMEPQEFEDAAAALFIARVRPVS
ncbi:tubulin polyglutamylase complex subunit 1 [Anguilla rostrata]|uniref:tubulin polyglutamylase complex subunit 1 n=1 Tax=Anguilla rostrata TaxID=7938 RepID=UPI0030D59D09